MEHFKNVLPPTTSSIKTLPILHSCEAINVQNILKTKQLNTTKCDVFKEDYLYAFYGIPSYRKKMAKSTANPGYYPVCFIFDYDLIPDMNRLHPCDTGAFAKLKEVKEDHFHESIELNHLELDANIEEAKKIVTKFYLNNNNYIRQKPQIGLEEIGVINPSAYGYTSLINDKSSTLYDNRVATIELIFNIPIKITKENLNQIIVPAVYLDEPSIEDLITNTYDIKDPLFYETIKGSPSENFGAIYNLYLNYVKQNNLS